MAEDDVTMQGDDAMTSLLDALGAATPAHATAEFDRVVASLVARGLLEPAAAQEVRWWQRQSVQAVVDHLAATAPPTIASVIASRSAALESVAAARAAWADAVRDEPTDPSPNPPPEPTRASPPSESAAEDHLPADAPSHSHEDPPGATEPAESEVIDLRSPAQREPAHEWAGVAFPTTAEQSLRSPQRRLLVTGLSMVPGRPSGRSTA